jgi:hypothetical protein
MLNLETIADEMADHIANMARVPGFKDYARERLKELVRTEKELFGNLPALVKQRLEKEK